MESELTIVPVLEQDRSADRPARWCHRRDVMALGIEPADVLRTSGKADWALRRFWGPSSSGAAAAGRSGRTAQGTRVQQPFRYLQGCRGLRPRHGGHAAQGSAHPTACAAAPTHDVIDMGQFRPGHDAGATN